MFRKMLLHMVAATLLITAAAFTWQAVAQDEGIAQTAGAVTGVFSGGHGGKSHGD